MTCPPSLLSAGVDSVFESTAKLIRSATDLGVAALGRRAGPWDVGLDMLDWYTTVFDRARPQWTTPHKIAAHWPIARLRDFSSADATENLVATLILPPQAGHDSCIVDYAREQSQVGTARAAGLTRLFALDWVGATQSTKSSTIDDYLQVLIETVQRLGGRVNLVGDCQGGWLAVIYAALYPDSVHTLTIAGAPVDFRAGEPVIGAWMQLLARDGDLTFYRAMVGANGGVMPGEYLLAGFIGMQPHAEVGRQLDLLTHIRDAEHVQRYRVFENWFKHTQAVPGAFYLWIVEHLFQNNELVAGTLRIGDRTVDLGEIRSPLYLLAGSADHITPAPQVYALGDHAGTDAPDVHQRLADGGHLGLFMGHDALRHHWAPLFAEIAAQSR